MRKKELILEIAKELIITSKIIRGNDITPKLIGQTLSDVVKEVETVFNNIED